MGKRLLLLGSIALLLLGRAEIASAQALGTIRTDDSAFRTSPLDGSGIAAKRSQIIKFIWGSGGFPSSKQPSFHKFVLSPVGGLSNLQSVDAIRISMETGEYSLGYHFLPANNRRNRVVIVHTGHECYIDDGPGTGQPDGGIRRVINALLNDGYGVLALSMPRFSPPTPDLPDPGNCKGNHDSMFNLALSGNSNALKFFLEPVVVGINYLSQSSSASPVHYSDFNMVGLSGGGWTTVLAAAVDTRINLSFPVAGSVPLYLRVEPYTHDKEQYLNTFYGALNPATTGIAGYLDLYLLGSRGAGRGQVQVLNRHDNCCFGEPQHNTSILQIQFEPAVRVYESRIKSVAVGAPGLFRVVLDEVSPSDMISDNAIRNVILPILGDATQITGIATTVRAAWGTVCMDVPDVGRPPRNGDRLQVFQCHGSLNQQFTLQNDGSIRTKWGGFCLDVPDFGRPPKNGDPMQIFTCHGGFNQQFDLERGAIRSRRGGLCIDVPDFGRPPQNGDRLQVFQCHGLINQQFTLQNDGSIRSKWGGLCLDVPDFGRPPQNGDPMQIFTCHGGSNQKFDLESDGTIRSRWAPRNRLASASTGPFDGPFAFDIKSLYPDPVTTRRTRGPKAETWLGATQPTGTVPIVLFVPSQDRDGRDIDHDYWVTRALETLGTLFRGATAYPRARGVWRDDEREGGLRYEEPTVVTCYADPAAMTETARSQLRGFLHRLGRETNQGEVGIVIADKYYGITEFDSQ